MTMICAKCRKEMQCLKTGVYAAWNLRHHCYAGDLFECPQCGCQVIKTAGTSMYLEHPEKIPSDVFYDIEE